MQYKVQSPAIKKLLLGALLRCPNCERGGIVGPWLRMNSICPHCGVRYERSPGESTGAMILVLSGAPILALIAYFILDARLHPPLWIGLGFALALVVALCLLLYWPARGLWIAVSYLGGGVYADADADQPQP